MQTEDARDKHRAQGANSGTLLPWWATALRSPSLGDQLWAVQQSREAAVMQGLDVPMRET